jgi:nucleoside-diphosphate-sugar epimerase
VHLLDSARLYRLALEKREPGAKYHTATEEGMPFRYIAEAIGRGLKVPVVSLPRMKRQPILAGSQASLVGI